VQFLGTSGSVRLRAVVPVSFAPLTLMQWPATANAAAPPRAVEVAPLTQAQTDADVFMRVDATQPQIAAVEQEVRSSADVRRFAHLSKEDAYQESQRLFRAKPDLVASVTAADLPESFRVDLREGASPKRWSRRFGSPDGVDSVETPSASPSEEQLLSTIRACQGDDGADVEVFMQVDATDAQLAATQAAVRAETTLTVVRVHDHDAAYQEFERIFADRPKLRDRVTPAQLPMSIRATSDGPVTSDVLARLRALDGVDSVETPSASCQSIRRALASGYAPEQLAHVMELYAKERASRR